MAAPADVPPRVPLARVVREWGRIGCLGFGGPPAHVAMLRELVVARRAWLSPDEFEDGVAATNLLPGPASTQLAVYTAWRVRGAAGAVAGGLAFVLPGLVAILALAALFLASHPPAWVLGAGAGAGAAVPAVAVRAAWDLLPGSWARAGAASRSRWAAYVAAGAAAAVLAGAWVVLALLACGAAELVARRSAGRPAAALAWPLAALASGTGTGAAGWGSLAWTAFKVGALSYGGGFVIIPLMRDDAVGTYRWMSDAQFLNAVALGQVTPGPVVHTVAAVGYASHGVGGGLLAACVAFAPSFALVLLLAPRFDALRASPCVRAFLDGAGPAAVGAILGVAVPLARALPEPWQAGVLAAAAVALLAARRGVVEVLAAAGVVGAVLAVVGVPPGG